MYFSYIIQIVIYNVNFILSKLQIQNRRYRPKAFPQIYEIELLHGTRIIIVYGFQIKQLKACWYLTLT